MPRSRRALCPGLLLVLVMVLVSARPVDAQSAPKVERVILEGNVLIRTKSLLSLMETRHTGWLFHRKRYDEAIFKEDLTAIRTFYLNSGFLDMRFLRTPVVPSADGKRVTIRVLLREGPRYTVKQVKLRGNRLLSDADITKVLLMEAGQPFLRLFMASDRRAIQILAAQRALLDAVVADSAVVNPQDTTITVTYTLNEGEPMRVGAIEVRGLNKTRRGVVLRELLVKPGELYDYDKITQSQRRLYQTNLFRSVRVEPGDSLVNPRPLFVGVTELPGGEVEVGAGYGTREGFRGNVGVVQKNWLGRGVRVGTNAQASLFIQKSAVRLRNARMEAGVTQPWLLGTRTIGDVRGFFDRRDKESFVSRNIGATVTASRELSVISRTQTAYTIEQVTITAISPDLKQLLQRGRGVPDSLRSRRDGSLSQVIIYDTRDDPLNTTRGLFAQVQGNLISPVLGGSIRSFDALVSITGSLREYVSVRKFPAFATSVSFGYVRALGPRAKVPLDKQLFLGGDRSVRGFDIFQIGQPAGGRVAVSSQNELRVPVWIVDVAGFIDFGGVAPAVSALSLDDIQVGYGGGLRISSPIGLIRGDLGFHRFSRYDDAKARDLIDRTVFYFGLGQAF